MINEISLIIDIDFENPEYSRIIYAALYPETKSAPTERSKASIFLEGSRVKIQIKSHDPISTRAAFNSYIRWISAILSTLDLVNKSTI